ncbi:TraU protein [Pseudomonas syringae pv. cilantro]|uniref:TraU protein n=1 Tax=Pseudomonas syringae pv. cilantro TaxID=81035 RepID=A0A0N0X9X7_PSESX|nr:conjugal transfer protein TraU [Pseudomonas syringae]KPC31057.1 TraU protein [Pseudomonas syringae pv. cilantro]
MGVLEKCVDAVEGAIEYLARHLINKDMTSYCELMTAVGVTDEDIRRSPDLKDPYTLVNNGYSLLTVFDLQGTFQMLSEHEFAAMIESLRVRMTGYMKRYGHSLTFSFERDPERAKDELMRLAEPLLNTARRIGLETEDIILDRVMRNYPLCSWEQNILVVYTHLNAMSSEEQKRELNALTKSLAKHDVPRMQYGQNPAFALSALKYRHDTMIKRIQDDFANCGVDGQKGIMMKPLNAHEAVKRVRIMINREGTSQKFRPTLLGDRHIPSGPERSDDYSDLVPPRLSYQICSNNVEPHGNFIRTSSLWHGSLGMELGPQDPLPFKELFSAVDQVVPWRIRFDLNPCGLHEVRVRRMVAGFVGVLPSNHSIREAFAYLEKLQKEEAVLSMKVTASTWAEDENTVKQRMSSLEKSLQSWGTCQVNQNHGDPMAALASTIPAFTTKNPANRLLLPLNEALGMLPLQRPATPWAETGSWILRTPEGKIYPVGLGSTIQDTWIDLVSGTQGSGKSVTVNTMNSATIHRPGAIQLPLMTIVDVGHSSSGLIQVIRDSLPEHRKNEAVFLKLQNSIDYAVNPFDTQLGARNPTNREREFQVDFLNLLCTDTELGRAPAEVSRVNERLVTLVYDDRAEKGAIQYEPEVVPLLDKILLEAGILAEHDEKWWSTATWYEVTDMLFAAGYVQEATIAQRQASPVLSDFNAMLNNESIKQMFGAVHTKSGEPLLAYMSRCFVVATTTFALFSRRTRFDLDATTRVISIDLNDVIGSKTAEGAVKTSCMYLFARQLAAKNYFLRREELLQVVPELYAEYHIKRADDIASQQKIIAYDEWHNTYGLEAPVQTIIKDGREGRKWGIRIIAISQFMNDFPQPLLDASTSVYVLRGGNRSDENVLRESFQVSDQTISELHRKCVGPTAEGANMLAIFKTNQGTITQILTNTTGALELWAFSTTQQDVSLRTALYSRLGSIAARRVLAARFPLGTAKTYIEQLELQAGAEQGKSVVMNLADEMTAEYRASRTAGANI